MLGTVGNSPGSPDVHIARDEHDSGRNFRETEGQRERDDMAVKVGRPRLDHRPGFMESFAAILPRLSAREISQREAAQELGVSVRSLVRYMHRATSTTPRPNAEELGHDYDDAT